ncbi:MAG: hypothetical protein O2788_01715 [Chloroflexi bacterium]|nr:hypothetical protein [Chloroflexota bacterium]
MIEPVNIRRLTAAVVFLLLVASMLACTPGAGGPTVEPTPDYKAIADATYTAGTVTAAAEMGIDLSILPDGTEVDPAVASPIKATLYQDRQATEYVLEPVFGGSVVEWTNPPCGPTSVAPGGLKMTWTHAHPPCDATTDHSDVTITVLLRFNPDPVIRYAHCDYQGAHTGTGKPCVWGQ